jgi:hypothetical protein
MLQLIPSFSKRSLPFRISDTNVVHLKQSHPCYMFAHFILLYLITLIIFGEVTRLIIMQLFSSFLPLPDSQVEMLFSNTISLSINKTHSVSPTYKTRVHFNLIVFRQQTGSQIIKWTVASIPCI